MKEFVRRTWVVRGVAALLGVALALINLGLPLSFGLGVVIGTLGYHWTIFGDREGPMSVFKSATWTTWRLILAGRSNLQRRDVTGGLYFSALITGAAACLGFVVCFWALEAMGTNRIYGLGPTASIVAGIAFMVAYYVPGFFLSRGPNTQDC